MSSDSRERGEWTESVVSIRRCAAVVKGGRRFSFNALVVVGNGRGQVAWGYGKANEVPPAVEKAAKDAHETLKRQPRITMAGATIPHRIIGKFGASKVILVPAGPGTGVKAGPGVRDVLEAAGIQNILTKVHGSSNPMNLVKATIAGGAPICLDDVVVGSGGTLVTTARGERVVRQAGLPFQVVDLRQSGLYAPERMVTG